MAPKAVATKKPKDEPVDPVATHDYSEWTEHIAQFVTDAETKLRDVQEQLTTADAQVAQWQHLWGAPALSPAGKARIIQPHADFWKSESTRLREESKRLESDLNDLKQVTLRLGA